MPELIEVELYRQLAERVVGRTVARVETPDHWFLKGVTAAQVQGALTDSTVAATERRGKLLMMAMGEERPVLGLRFGMTGRLLLDGRAAIDKLEYGSGRQSPAWERFALVFTDGSRLHISDPRRLGAVELDPDVTRLGPDAAAVTAAQLRAILLGSNAPLKARLLDQARLAGLGNLLVDETLFRAGLSPLRSARGLSTDEVSALARTIRSTVARLTRRGGSHRGDLQEHRHRGGHCPRDGCVLVRETVGGRTTYWCPRHQL